MAKVDFPVLALSFLLFSERILFKEINSFTFNSHTFLAMHYVFSSLNLFSYTF